MGRKLTVEPEVPAFVKVLVKMTPVIFTKLWIQSGLHGVKTKQAGSKAMDGANLAPLQMTKRFLGAKIDFLFSQMVALDETQDLSLHLRLVCIHRYPVQSRSSIGLETLAQANLHFIGGLIGKRQSHKLRDFHWVGLAHQQVNQAIHQQGRLSRPCTSGDDDILIEGRRCSLALRSVS